MLHKKLYFFLDRQIKKGDFPQYSSTSSHYVGAAPVIGLFEELCRLEIGSLYQVAAGKLI